jgi:hypothetical protein
MPLFKGYGIGPGRNFAAAGMHPLERTSGIGYEFYHRHAFGPWANKQDQYLGVAFLIDGATHYGWIRMTVTIGQDWGPFLGTVTGYAYETVANQSIHAGQLSDGDASAKLQNRLIAQPSLGMLALGAPGMDLWRRDDSLSAPSLWQKN